MALDSIPALPRPGAVRSALQAPLERQARPDTAQVLHLVLAADASGELLGRSEQGQVYRLLAAGQAAPWREGQTLLVQVLRTGPPLEVRVLGLAGGEGMPSAAGLYGLDIDLPALRPDQAAILRLAAAANDTMALAAHWRQRTLAALQQAATLAPAHSSVSSADVPATPNAGEAALLLRVLPWHGWPLTLWLEQRRWTGGPNRRARRRAGTRLCLSVALAPLGQIGLVLDVLDVQVGLTLTVADAASVAPLRAQVGAIAARMARAGLRLMRCHVRHDPDFAVPAAATTLPAIGSHELPLALFRAGTEALEALRRHVGRGAR